VGMNKRLKDVLGFIGIGKISGLIQLMVIGFGVFLMAMPADKYNNLLDVVGFFTIFLFWPVSAFIQTALSFKKKDKESDDGVVGRIIVIGIIQTLLFTWIAYVIWVSVKS